MSDRLSVPVTTLFRLVVGLIFAVHGAATVLGLFGGSRGTGAAVAAAGMVLTGRVRALRGLSSTDERPPARS